MDVEHIERSMVSPYMEQVVGGGAAYRSASFAHVMEDGDDRLLFTAIVAPGGVAK